MQNVHLYLFKLYNGFQEVNRAWYLLYYIPFMYYTIVVEMIKYLYIEICWKKFSGVYLTFSHYCISCFDKECPLLGFCEIVRAYLQK